MSEFKKQIVEKLQDLSKNIDVLKKELESNELSVQTLNKTFNKRDPLGIKNVNFSDELAFDPKDSRFNSWKKQRLKLGFDQTEIWCLDSSIYRFILPRLKYFKKIALFSPMSFYNEKHKLCYVNEGFKNSPGNYSDGIIMRKNANSRVWRKMLEKMIWALEQEIKRREIGYYFNNQGEELTFGSPEYKKKEKKVNQGLELLWANFGALNY